MKASLFFEDTLRGNAIFSLPGKGRAAWMLRNVTPTVTRTPPRSLRQHKRFCYRLLRFTVRSIIMTKEHVCRRMLLRSTQPVHLPRTPFTYNICFKNSKSYVQTAHCKLQRIMQRASPKLMRVSSTCETRNIMRLSYDFFSNLLLIRKSSLSTALRIFNLLISSRSLLTRSNLSN